MCLYQKGKVNTCRNLLMHAFVCRDEKPADALTVRHGPETDDYNRDFIERDEKRLADLGRKTVEMYVIAHIIADLEVSLCSLCIAVLFLFIVFVDIACASMPKLILYYFIVLQCVPSSVSR